MKAIKLIDPVTIDNGLFFILSDQLGSTSITANSSGTKVAEVRYTAWGQTRFTWTAAGYAWGSTSVTNAAPTTDRFTGQRQEAGLGGADGLYYYGARFYDPYLNRWTSPDSIIPNQYDPQDWNRYAYVHNFPVNFNDPSGHLECDPDGECIRYTSDGYRILPQLKGNQVIYGNTFHNPVEMAYANYILSGGDTNTLASVPQGAPPVAYLMAFNNALAGLGLGYDNPLVEHILADPYVLMGMSSAIIIGFGSPALLTQHFLQHGAEFGFTSEADYENAATTFAYTQGSDGVLSKVRANGDTII